MTKEHEKLQKKFLPENRAANFGRILIRMQVARIRNHRQTDIHFQSPITAITGLNGTGKSTLLQLAACAYKGLTNGEAFSITDFIVPNPLDPSAFGRVPMVLYTFFIDESKTRRRGLYRRQKRWSGYERRLQRDVKFIGFRDLIPRIEQTDFVIRQAKKLQITKSESLPSHAKESISKILGSNYEDVVRSDVTYGTNTKSVFGLKRAGTQYSEIHMGYGERRCLYLINQIEALPKQSLILLEEPESSLHSRAQIEFANYLVQASLRHGHQIIMTTHSEHILSALPVESRIYLHRTADSKIEIFAGLASSQVRSLLSEGRHTALQILVEDEVAKAVLRALLRQADPGLLKCIKIHAVNMGAQQLRQVAKGLENTHLPIAVVLDGDMPASEKEHVFKLPGTRPPEKEIFDCENFAELVKTEYGTNLPDFLAAEAAGTDHHNWFGRLSEKLNESIDVLINKGAEAYLLSVAEDETSWLTAHLKACVR